MIRNICYITYQTFPASTANSLQTISNIKYFTKNKCDVSLIYPLREKSSSSSVEKIQDFYNTSIPINIKGVEHNYPFGKMKFFEGFMFHISHYLWAKKTVKKVEDNIYDFYITRSDWIFYFLLKKTNKRVIFECHKVSKLRKIILRFGLKKSNAKVIYLNKNLMNIFSKFNTEMNTIVLHNGVDLEDFKNSYNLNKNMDIIFIGNLQRFSKSRNIKFAIDGFVKSKLSNSFSLKIIGGPEDISNSLRDYVNENYRNENIKILGQLGRIEAKNSLNKARVGVLINDNKDEHSYLHSSPLKYFEYLASNLKVVAADFPAHNELPYSENIIFFNHDNIESFSNALEQSIDKEFKNIDLDKISLDYRVKKILEFINK